MGKLDRVITMGALLCACSADRVPLTEGPPAAIPRAKAALAAPEDDPRFDREGHLRPGSLKIGWFEIPLGFERIPGTTERSGSYEAAGITPAQLRQYVTARGTPTTVEYMKYGEIYQQLAPTHTRLPLPPVDVTVLVVDAKTQRLRLVVDDHAPTGEPTLTPREAMDQLAKARERTE